MILHAAELWATLAACFLIGCMAGSLIYRAVGLTAAARFQGRLAHSVDRAVRILEWRLFPWRSRAPVPLPRVVPVPPPDYRHAEVVPVLPPIEWGDGDMLSTAPSLEAGLARSVFDSEALREAVDRADLAGTRPAVLSGPRLGQADDLAAISGLGKRHAARLAKIGIYHFSQIAAWTPQEAAWIGAYLGIGDAVREKDWIGKATRVAGSDDPEAAARPARRPPKARSRRGKGKSGKRKNAPDDGKSGETTGAGTNAMPAPPDGELGAASDEPESALVDPVQKVGDP